MATQQFQNPFLGPDILQKQYQMQQNQRYAQMLMDEGAQTPQGQMVGNHYVAPSITQYLANALKTYVGRKTADDLPNQQAQLQQAQQDQYRNMFGLGGDVSNAPSQSLAIGAQQGSVGPTNDNAKRLGNALAGQPQMPLLPGQSRENSYLAYSLMGPQEYMKMVAQQGAPTDVVKNMIAGGIDPNSAQGRAYLSSVLAKNASNNVNVRPGGSVFDANTGRVTYHAPNTNGTQIVDTPAGPAMYNVPGSLPATSAASTAQASGPASFRTSIVNLPGGQNVMMTDAQKSQWLTGADQQDPYLMAVLSTESGGNPAAVSPKGAVGPMQTLPSTLSNPGFGIQPAQSNSPQEMMRVGREYWGAMNQKYGSPALAAIAYNMGPAATDKWLSAGGDFSKLPAETQKYVASVMTKAAVNGRGQTAAPVAAGGAPGREVQGEGAIALNQQLGKDQAKELTTSRAAAINATDDLTNIAKERKTLEAGTFGGSGAQAKLNAVKFIQSWVPGLGNFDASKATNTDYLISVLGKGLLAHAKALGYNPTDADASRIEAIVGTIGKDPNALKKIIDFQEMMANRAIQRHNMLVAQAQKNGVQSSFDMSVSPQTGMPGSFEFRMVGNDAPTPSSGFKIIGVR